MLLGWGLVCFFLFFLPVSMHIYCKDLKKKLTYNRVNWRIRYGGFNKVPKYNGYTYDVLVSYENNYSDYFLEIPANSVNLKN